NGGDDDEGNDDGNGSHDDDADDDDNMPDIDVPVTDSADHRQFNVADNDEDGDSDTVIPDIEVTEQEEYEHRVQAFGMLSLPKLQQLMKGTKIPVKIQSTQNGHMYLVRVWKALAKEQKVALPEPFTAFGSAKKMRYRPEDLKSLTGSALELEATRLGIAKPSRSAGFTAYERLLKSYALGEVQKKARTSVLFRDREESRVYNALVARAKELRVSNGYKKNRRLTEEELQALIKEAEEREEARQRLETNPNLPAVHLTRPFKSVCLVYRCSSSRGRSDEIKYKNLLQQVEQALRQGKIMANLEDAIYDQFVWTRSANKPMPLGFTSPGTAGILKGLHEIQDKPRQGRVDVVMVICGVEGLSINHRSYLPFINQFPSLDFTLLIGESLAQWYGDSIGPATSYRKVGAAFIKEIMIPNGMELLWSSLARGFNRMTFNH
ncbi:MAG: hypothetical protein Q9174_003982, partial [Haloplaca sp. 1 TL-2023]